MKRILLIDLSAIFWRNWHATKDAELGSAFESTISKVRWLASSGYDGVAVCCDAPPYWRKKIAPDYKAQRDAPEPAAVDQLRRVIERLKLDGFQVWKSDGFEADDVIASAVAWAVQAGHAVHVASADKDLTALVCESVQMRHTGTDDVYDSAKVLEKFGVEPWQMPDFLALVGDKSDNVRGVPGVGNVKARELVKQYTSVPQLLAALRANVVVSTPAINTALQTASADGSLDLALQLVSLRTDVTGIEWNAAFAPREEKPLSDNPVEDMDPAEPEVTPTRRSDPPPAPPAPQAQQATQIVSVPSNSVPVTYSTALEPRDATSAFKLARAAVESRSFGVANAETALAMILRGRSLGIDAITSLTAFHIIKNKMALTATMIEGMVMASAVCDFFMCTESTSEKSTWVTKRKGYPKEQTLTWIFADAERLGLTGLDQWKKQPRTMLRHRCGTDLARMVYPDVIAGLYAVEELEER